MIWQTRRFQALTKNPNHERAMKNIRRTTTVVEEMDSTWMSNIDEKRNKVAAIPDTNVALAKAKKEAYFLVRGLLQALFAQVFGVELILVFTFAAYLPHGRNRREHYVAFANTLHRGDQNGHRWQKYRRT